MSEVLDEYLIHLQEGIWTAVVKALEFPTAKHPRYKRILKQLNDRYIMCRSSFPGLDNRIRFNTKYGSIQYGEYIQHPDYTNCLNSAYLDFANDFLDWVKRAKIKEVCKYNRNFEKCSKWVENEVLDRKDEIKNLKRQMEFMKKGRKISKPQYDTFVSALYKKG